jgi:hypothetical protein
MRSWAEGPLAENRCSVQHPGRRFARARRAQGEFGHLGFEALAILGHAKKLPRMLPLGVASRVPLVYWNDSPGRSKG